MSKKRYERNGRVGVIISPGYGAGLYTSYKVDKDFVFDPVLIKAILNNESIYKHESYIRETYGDDIFYDLDMSPVPIDMEVTWVEKGRSFSIQEYDGHEYICYPELLA